MENKVEIYEGLQFTHKHLATIYTIVGITNSHIYLDWKDRDTDANINGLPWAKAFAQSYFNDGTWIPVENKEESKVIVINPTKELKPKKDWLNIIGDKDPEFLAEITKLLDYLASTYSDKYEGESSNYAKDKLLSKEGKAANIFTALKYIKRYDTVGYSKSENPQDLLKSIHYLLFENQRKNKHGV